MIVKIPYGHIDVGLIEKFCELAGWRYGYDEEEWTVLTENVEYWKLVNPASIDKSKRWAKVYGELPIRDLNFQYAYYLSDCDVEKALEYIEEKLIDEQGQPVYLPDRLAMKAGLSTEIKPPGYSRIINDEIEAYKNRNEQ